MKHTVIEVTLKDGARGLLINVPNSSVVNFDFNFRAGDYLSPKDKPETAHIMEHLVLGANGRYKTSSEFSREFSKNGAYNNASTGTYHMSYVAECAEFEALRILDLLCVSIEAPLFLESEFKAEVANVKEELKSRRNNHMSELSLAMGNKLGLLDMTYTDRSKLVSRVELADVKKHYKATHKAKNLRFIIAGNIAKKETQIIERLESLQIEKGVERTPLPEEIISSPTGPITHFDSAVENIYYRWESVIDHVLSDKEALEHDAVMALLMSTMHSRVFGAARERGLAYGINYGKYHTRDNHLWYVGGQVLPEHAAELFKLIVNQLELVSQGDVGQAELDELILFSLGSFQRGYQTVGSLIDAYSENYFFNDEIEDFASFEKRIKSVTREGIQHAAQLCLAPHSHWAIGFYGATKEIDPKNLQAVIAEKYQKTV
jgi:predicted Zn-dependent peptidase